MENWTLRAATADDATALADCIRAAYAAYAGRINDLPDVAAGIDADIRDHAVWVASSGDQIVGGAVLVLGDAAKLANLAVHPDAGGQGLGRALIGQVETAVREAGFGHLRLATHVGIPENVALYARLGWTETDRSGNKVLMSKPLGS